MTTSLRLTPSTLPLFPTLFPRACTSLREVDAVGLLDGRDVLGPFPPLEILAVNDLEYFDSLVNLWLLEEWSRNLSRYAHSCRRQPAAVVFVAMVANVSFPLTVRFNNGFSKFTPDTLATMLATPALKPIMPGLLPILRVFQQDKRPLSLP